MDPFRLRTASGDSMFYLYFTVYTNTSDRTFFDYILFFNDANLYWNHINKNKAVDRSGLLFVYDKNNCRLLNRNRALLVYNFASIAP